MTKKILFAMAFVASVVACTDDYKDWATPQQVPQPETVSFGDGSVSTVGVIDFNGTVGERVKVCNITAPTASDPAFTPSYSIALGNTTYNIDADGTMKAAELQDYVINNFGRRPVERDIDATVSMWLNGPVTTVKSATSGVFQIKAIPQAPHISENYYLVGGTKDWAGSAASKEQKFSHSGKDVYEDPVFTIVIDASQTGDTWFAIGDDEACEAIANNNDWSKLLGTTKGNGNTDLTGTLAPRYELSDDGSFCVPQGNKLIKVTINMMDYSYKIEPVNISENYYLVGGPLDWAASAASKEQKFSHSDKDVFEDPVFTIVFAASEGDTWFAFGDDEACDAIGGGDWSKLFGTKGESTDLSGSFDRRYNLGDDHSFCVPAGSGKFIRLEVNMMENTYKIIPLNYQEYIYEIGNETGWQIPHALRSENFDGKYQGYYYLDGEFKFKPNADDWNGDWENDGEGRIADNGGSNMPGVGAGFYRINVDLSAMTYAVKLIEHVSIIGTVNGNWDNDTDLTYNKDEGCWEVTCDLNAGNMKFRGNHNWDGDVDLGGSFDNLVHGGSDIAIEAGNYTIKLYISVSGQHHAVVTKN